MLIFLSEQDGGAAAECSLKVRFLTCFNSISVTMFKITTFGSRSLLKIQIEILIQSKFFK